MTIEIKLLSGSDNVALSNIASGVFDHDINQHRAMEFLNDPRHHLAVAIDGNLVVGFASAIHYLHPDKSPNLWINEVGVASAYRSRGLATKLLNVLFEVGRGLGCVQAWVLTDRSNVNAMRLYSSIGGIEAPNDQVMFIFGLTPEGS